MMSRATADQSDRIPNPSASRNNPGIGQDHVIVFLTEKEIYTRPLSHLSMGTENSSQDIAQSDVSRRSFLGSLGAGSGYLVLGDVNNAGANGTGTSSKEGHILVGHADACPEPEAEGRLYIAIDTGERFYDTSDQWQSLDITAPTGKFEDLQAKNTEIGIHESPFKPLRRSYDARDRWVSTGWLKDNFEDLSDWKVVSGSMSADENNAFLADQSAKLTTANVDEEVVIEKSIDATDFSDWDVSIGARLDSSAGNRQHVEVVLLDGSNRSLVYRGPMQSNEGWVQSNMGVYSEDSGVDITNIQTIRIRIPPAGHQITTFSPATGTHADQQTEGPLQEGTIKVWVDNLRYHPRPDTAQCVLTFDDATISHYKFAFPIMQEFGFSGFASAPTDSVGSEDNLTIEQMHEMQQYGWEFGSETQTHSHTSQLSPEEIRTELEGSKRWLLEHGFDRGAEFLTYPYSDHSEEVVNIASDYYAMARSVADSFIGDGLNRATLTNPLHIVGHSVYSSNISEAKSFIDLAVKYNQTIVLNFHGFNEYAWKEMHPDEFREVVEYLHSKGTDGLQVVSYSDWWDNLSSFHIGK